MIATRENRTDRQTVISPTFPLRRLCGKLQLAEVIDHFGPTQDGQIIEITRLVARRTA